MKRSVVNSAFLPPKEEKPTLMVGSLGWSPVRSSVGGEAELAALLVNGVRYLETGEETNTIGVFFRFDEAEANGITIREYGFFGGDVQYVQSVTGDLAMGGVFHQDTNPTGEVLRPGYLYEVKNIPDFNKISDTRVELVGIIKI